MPSFRQRLIKQIVEPKLRNIFPSSVVVGVVTLNPELFSVKMCGVSVVETLFYNEDFTRSTHTHIYMYRERITSSSIFFPLQLHNTMRACCTTVYIATTAYFSPSCAGLSRHGVYCTSCLSILHYSSVCKFISKE